MSSNEYSIQNVHRYTRKSYNNRAGAVESCSVSPRDDIRLGGTETSQKNERYSIGSSGCNCDPEGEVAHTLHRKCPVIALAQKQLQKLSDETDVILSDNTGCCRSVYNLLHICKDALWNQNKCKCATISLLFCVFVSGLLMGSATCGATYGKFNSQILTCIDNFFISDSYSKIEDTFRSIV